MENRAWLLRNRTPSCRIGESSMENFFFSEFHRAREVHDKSMAWAMCNERDFPLFSYSHTGCSCHACSSYRGKKCATKRDKKKRKEERVNSRHSRQAAWNRLASCVLVASYYWSLTALLTAHRIDASVRTHMCASFHDILTRHESRM